MAHYALLDENNKVVDAFKGVDETELIDGLDPETWYSNFHGKRCLRYSINTRGGVHELNGIPFRKNPAGIGWSYSKEYDGFYSFKPFESWILNTDTLIHEPPMPYPTDGKRYKWDEDTVSWVEIKINFEGEL